MHILYAAYRHNPHDPMSASGADFQFYQALSDHDFEVSLVGPFTEPPYLPERLVRRLHTGWAFGRYPKYNLSTTYRAARTVNMVAKIRNPDLIFTLYPPTIAFYQGNKPCLLRTDTTFLGMNAEGSEFLQHGKAALALMVWLERLAFQKCTNIITHSEWSGQVLQEAYGIPPHRIKIFPNPAALPESVIPDRMDYSQKKTLAGTVRLLFVGRDFKRKGLDLALEIVEKLNNVHNIPAMLTVCGGTNHKAEKLADHPFINVVGPFNKNIPQELHQFMHLYEEAHFLLHPARFDASPIVTSEAAAFGTPTITNASGGLATSVKDGESGIVLPKGSSADAYAKVIQDLVKQPERYYALCHSTRQRYDRELNWQVAGQCVAEILHTAIREQSFA